VSLTHHYSRYNEKGYLLCHYCGFKSAVPLECPKCKNKNMRFMGYGTQLAEEQIKKLFPDARILRMDADTTTGKFSYDDLLTRFRNKEADILIGTQMVTKGHDFPEVTLVGMLSADQSLFVDDYRANERTFSLICQTVGRAGRRDEEGHALIQCYNPDHSVLEVAKEQDYKAFYENEIPLRRSLLFPPFCDIAAITVTSDNEGNAFTAAQKLLDSIKELQSGDFKDVKLQIFGPFEAPVYKLNEKFRVRLIIKCKNTKQTRALFRNALRSFGQNMPKTVTVGIDINPTTL
jgi:primosomal protein N' (replication factor Y)